MEWHFAAIFLLKKLQSGGAVEAKLLYGRSVQILLNANFRLPHDLKNSWLFLRRISIYRNIAF